MCPHVVITEFESPGSSRQIGHSVIAVRGTDTDTDARTSLTFPSCFSVFSVVLSDAIWLITIFEAFPLFLFSVVSQQSISVICSLSIFTVSDVFSNSTAEEEEDAEDEVVDKVVAEVVAEVVFPERFSIIVSK